MCLIFLSFLLHNHVGASWELTHIFQLNDIARAPYKKFAPGPANSLSGPGYTSH